MRNFLGFFRIRFSHELTTINKPSFQNFLKRTLYAEASDEIYCIADCLGIKI